MAATQQDFKQWFRSLTRLEREDFARRCGISVMYMESRLVQRKGHPKAETMQKLAEESFGRFTYDGLVDWFYKGPSV
ncbi:MAG: hypothetical protein ACK6D3_24105 [Planctomycetaceae bacterium]|jgi:transcriptional regulator with XRE-family HTH domain